MTPVAHCPKCRRGINGAQSESWCVGCGTPLSNEISRLLPRVVLVGSMIEANAADVLTTLVIFPPLSAAVAAVTLLIARKAKGERVALD